MSITVKRCCARWRVGWELSNRQSLPPNGTAFAQDIGWNASCWACARSHSRTRGWFSTLHDCCPLLSWHVCCIDAIWSFKHTHSASNSWRLCIAHVSVVVDLQCNDSMHVLFRMRTVCSIASMNVIEWYSTNDYTGHLTTRFKLMCRERGQINLHCRRTTLIIRQTLCAVQCLHTHRLANHRSNARLTITVRQWDLS